MKVNSWSHATQASARELEIRDPVSHRTGRSRSVGATPVTAHTLKVITRKRWPNTVLAASSKSLVSSQQSHYPSDHDLWYLSYSATFPQKASDYSNLDQEGKGQGFAQTTYGTMNSQLQVGRRMTGVPSPMSLYRGCSRVYNQLCQYSHGKLPVLTTNHRPSNLLGRICPVTPKETAQIFRFRPQSFPQLVVYNINSNWPAIFHRKAVIAQGESV